MALTSTAYVILGMLSKSPMSGYDIKQLVDRSARFFWAASYSQIYAELRQLEELGLAASEELPQGGRPRKVYELTGAGRELLGEWLAIEPTVFEMRDEALLKLFFAGAAPETAVATLEAKRSYHREIAARLRSFEDDKAPGHALMVLRYGIECHQFMADWCDRALAELPELEVAGR